MVTLEEIQLRLAKAAVYQGLLERELFEGGCQTDAQEIVMQELRVWAVKQLTKLVGLGANPESPVKVKKKKVKAETTVLPQTAPITPQKIIRKIKGPDGKEVEIDVTPQTTDPGRIPMPNWNDPGAANNLMFQEQMKAQSIGLGKLTAAINHFVKE